MTDVLRRGRGVLLAIVVLALSAGLAFGAQPPSAASWGLSNAATHAGKTVPVQAGQDEAIEEGTDETVEEEQSTETAGEAGENCATDPTTLADDALAELRHGSIACWAAHQTEWPDWFGNHGAFVSCWAHQGKADATSCTEEPTAEAAAAGNGNGKGQGQGKGKGKSKNH